MLPKKGRNSKGKTPVFALLSLEQPRYATMLQNKYALAKTFDLLATYSLEPKYPGTSIPNLPLTYYPLHILSPTSVLQPPRPYKEKTGYGTGVSVVLFTSNCHNAGASGRFKYVEELMKHITVHSYGKCLHNRDEPKLPDDPAWPQLEGPQRRARKVKVLSHYKFYLAFEVRARPRAFFSPPAATRFHPPSALPLDAVSPSVELGGPGLRV